MLRTSSTGVYSSSNASATALFVSLPSIVFIPFLKFLSWVISSCMPVSAIILRYFIVALVSAFVDWWGTCPGMFVMQQYILPSISYIGSSWDVGLDAQMQPP